MTHRAAARLAAALLPAAVLVPAAAHAERVVVRDPGHDVARIDDEASDAAGTEVAVTAPGEASTDITRVVVDHRAGLLRLTVQVRDLRHRFVDAAGIRLRSPTWRWDVDVIRSGRETYTLLTRGARGSDRPCGGLVTTVDTRADRLIVSVPTTCIEDPRWVRVGVALLAINVPQGSTIEDADIYMDEAGVTGFHGDRDPLLGPRVHRG
jgi:hypothetical protein